MLLIENSHIRNNSPIIHPKMRGMLRKETEVVFKWNHNLANLFLIYMRIIGVIWNKSPTVIFPILLHPEIPLKYYHGRELLTIHKKIPILFS